MKGFAQPFFITLAANIFVFALGFLEPGFFFFILFAIPIELLVGLLLLFFEQHRPTGAALLAAGGVMLLIAGFVCSSVSYGFH